MLSLLASSLLFEFGKWAIGAIGTCISATWLVSRFVSSLENRVTVLETRRDDDQKNFGDKLNSIELDVREVRTALLGPRK